jgi:hypothetical protein
MLSSMDDHDISNIIQRVAALEVRLGLNGSLDTNPPSENISLPANYSSRIDALYNLLNSRFSSQESLNFSLQSELSTCQNLAKDLDPSGLLLASSNTPLNISEHSFIFRRQELIARCEDLQTAFQALSQVRDLLSCSYPILTKMIQERHQGPSSFALDVEQHILAAPIISSPILEFSSESTNLTRLETVTEEILGLYERVSVLGQRVDELIEIYYSIMSTVNEKLVLALDEMNNKNVR